MSVAISVIMPIYNASSYIEKALLSILNQSFDDVEYVLVNDCSTDNTMELVYKIIEGFKEKNIKVFNNPMNMGLGYTRKFGLLQATGTYVLQIDSDDWIELDTCSVMYEMAQTHDADIVVSNYFENYPNCQREVFQNDMNVSNIDFRAILDGRLHGSVSNKLIKRSLYIENDIYPPENFSLHEDKIVTVKLFYYAKKVKCIDNFFLHYRKHNSSMTTVIVNDRIINDTISFIRELNDFFIKENLLLEYQNELNSCILYHKKVFMLDKKYYEYWDSINPEVNKLRYINGIKLYDWKKKIITALAMIFSKRIMYYALSYYKSS